MIDPSELKDFLEYDTQTGKMHWLHRPEFMFASKRAFIQWNQRYAGKIAGTKKPDSGYIIVSIHKSLYRLHRIAWAMAHGSWPDGEIDHINGVRDDNRLSNLRFVSRAENTKNKRLLCTNKSGYHGVFKLKNGKYRVKGGHKGTQNHLGYFDNLNDAVMAKNQFDRGHGFHQNHGVLA